jgi:anti-sigma B factor antagonist
MRELRIAARDLDGGVTVLDLDGALDKRTVGELEKTMTGLADRGRLRLVVNAERLNYISSDGMGVFLSHLIKIRKSGGDIKFCNMRDEARTVVSYLGLAKLLTIKETEREAVSDFKKAEPKDAAKEPDKLRIELEERGNVSVLILHGFIDRHTIELLDKTLRGLFDKSRSKLVIDCAELTYISSNGMGVFISYVNKARNLNGDIRFCAMRDIAKTVITMLGLHRLFQVFETRDQAVSSFAGDAPKK